MPCCSCAGAAVHHVAPDVELRQQPRYLLWRVLQIVVDRHDHVVARRPDARQQRIVLSVIAHQVDPPDMVILAP